MRYLADTFLLVIVANASEPIPDKVRRILDDVSAEVYASVVSAYEIGNKYRIGKMPHAQMITTMGFADWCTSLGFRVESLQSKVMMAASLHPTDHRDPWDRILAEQAREMGAAILSPDRAFDSFGIERIW